MNRRHVPVALVALVLLAALVRAVATSSSAAASGPGDDAEAVRTAYRVAVVDHNVQRRSSAIAAALAHASATGAQMITLQEVCWWQARDLTRRLPGWTVAWRESGSHSGCRRTGLAELADVHRTGIGVVALVPGRAAVSAPALRHQAGKERRGLACTHQVQRATTVHLCSVHLVNPGRSGDPRLLAVQLGQAREVRTLTARWAARGDVVVLAGDLNARPFSRPLDELYRFRGAGPFHEATACRSGVTVCRKAQAPTYDGLAAKLDYVFVSANRMVAGRGHAVRVVPTTSDHHLLRAWAYVDLSARPSSSRSR